MLDSTVVSCIGRDGTGRDGAELLRIALLCTALHLTGLDSTAVDLYGTWAMLDLNVLSW